MEPRSLADRRPRALILVRGCARRVIRAWTAPVPALPLALFRVAVAALTLAYLVRLTVELPLLHGPTGLVDQRTVETAYPFTRQPLFPSDAGLAVRRALLLLGCALCVPLGLGWRPRRVALALYLLVVCAVRSHFVVASVDDGIVHLLLFWAALLPVGESLSIDHGKRLRRLVPGGAVRAASLNFALIYLVAGASKWTSEMWREGSALHAILSLRPSFWPEAVDAVPASVWALGSYGALAVEPLFALLVVLPSGSRVKAALGLVWFGFHAFLVATFDVGLANLGCVALGLLVFGNEIGSAVGRPARTSVPGRARLLPRDAVAAVVVALLMGAMATSLARSGWRDTSAGRDRTALHEATVSRAFYGPLWCMGLMQQYRLLDWIDHRNHACDFHATLDGAPLSRFDDRWLTPRTMRGTLLLAPLVGARWSPLPPHCEERVRDHLRERLAERIAHRVAPGLGAPAVLAVEARVTRVRLGTRPAPEDREILRALIHPDGDVVVLPPTEFAPCVASSP
ncbi:MAG: hypothetical protein AAF957_10245 [Planctomycetota bacterium]